MTYEEIWEKNSTKKSQYDQENNTCDIRQAKTYIKPLESLYHTIISDHPKFNS